jgi:hypothetical protein
MEQMLLDFVIILRYISSRFLWAFILAVPSQSYVPGPAKVFV